MKAAALTAQDRRLASRTVLQLYTVLRTVRFHDPSNKALLIATENLKDTINTLWAALDGSVRLQFVDGVVFLNDQRIQMDGSTKNQVDYLQEELGKRELGGLAFSRPVDGAALREFLVTLAHPISDTVDLEALKKSLLELKDLAVELLDPNHFTETDEEEPEVRVDKRTFAVQTYAKAVVALREFIDGLRAGREPNPRLRIMRIVQDLVDIADERSDYLVRLSSTRRVPEYAHGHAVNTCVLSIALGRSLDIDRVALADLGMSAIMADLGFALLPAERTETPCLLSSTEKDALLEAMLARLTALVGQGQVTHALVRRLIVAYEHHLPFRHPETGETGYTHLFSRIVQVADAYDALTTRRPWRAAMSPGEALRVLADESGHHFDPAIVRALGELLSWGASREETERRSAL